MASSIAPPGGQRNSNMERKTSVAGRSTMLSRSRRRRVSNAPIRWKSLTTPRSLDPVARDAPIRCAALRAPPLPPPLPRPLPPLTYPASAAPSVLLLPFFEKRVKAVLAPVRAPLPGAWDTELPSVELSAPFPSASPLSSASPLPPPDSPAGDSSHEGTSPLGGPPYPFDVPIDSSVLLAQRLHQGRGLL